MFSDLYLCVGSFFSCHCLNVHRYQCSVQPLLATSSQTIQYYFVPISKLLLKNGTCVFVLYGGPGGLLRLDFNCWVLRQLDFNCWVLLRLDFNCWVLRQLDFNCWVLLRLDFNCWVLRRLDFYNWTSIVGYFVVSQTTPLPLRLGSVMIELCASFGNRAL